MKTNQKSTVLRLLVLGMMVAGFSAKPASAQVLQGKFTLTSAIRWNQATLAAGEYTFMLDHKYPGNIVTVFRGTRTVARIQTASMSNIKSGNTEMVVESGTVRDVNLPMIGVRLHYPMPNSGHRAAPREPQLAQLIPVAMAGSGR